MDVLIDYVNQLNWVAVLAATVAAFAAGALWYSNGLFGKRWQKGAGLSDKDLKSASMGKSIGGGFAVTLISAVALAVTFDVLALEGVVDGALLGALVAVGFVASNKIMHNLFELKSNDYILVTVSGDVVALAVMGAVLGLLR